VTKLVLEFGIVVIVAAMLLSLVCSEKPEHFYPSEEYLQVARLIYEQKRRG